MSTDVARQDDLADVARLLRERRRVLQPEDVGLPRGPRRRTPGLRREEAAALCAISPAYYSRLEQRNPPRPSPTVLAGIARGLRFTRADRDHLFSAAGYDEGRHARGTAHVTPGSMHVLGRLADTPVMAVGPIGEILHQTPSACYLFGDHSHHRGQARSGYHRWFLDFFERQRFSVDEQAVIGAEIVADLRHTLCSGDGDRRARELVTTLLNHSTEFGELWRREPPLLGALGPRRCQIVHPVVGIVEVQREILHTVSLDHRLLIWLAVPGTESHTKLQLSTVLGYQWFSR
ncbi:helix-turn-helix transcriptional regulator [Mycobacterium sp. PS03-16]|uniref:helix-turn-helix transcriptional regulator n=1 Tax=Mycobacterium sp. PS03-16 TaxID=2559611 RepID=UPI00143007AD|nr:helix-turn-helix transcriptional regulator [Mycobacterium sp. PS03-16]